MQIKQAKMPYMMRLCSCFKKEKNYLTMLTNLGSPTCLYCGLEKEVEILKKETEILKEALTKILVIGSLPPTQPSTLPKENWKTFLPLTRAFSAPL